MATDYLSVTELAGEEVSKEQIERIQHRYLWAETYCAGKDVLEAACGTGQGLGLLLKSSKSLAAGDYSQVILDIASSHYGSRIHLERFDAQEMPFADKSFDVVILFEAIYYLASAEKFIKECRRVLRPGGWVLIATANKDLSDFNPSPHSHQYYGVVELEKLLTGNGFERPEMYGFLKIGQTSFRQQVLRPVKQAVVKLNLMPKTMQGKKILKRLVFGRLEKMPAEIEETGFSYQKPERIQLGLPDKQHKVLYAATKLKNP